VRYLARLLALFASLATTALAAVGVAVAGSWAGRQVDAALSATIGHAQSQATAWVVLATLVLCGGDVLRQRLRRNP
jgi:hypothetical protein